MSKSDRQSKAPTLPNFLMTFLRTQHIKTWFSFGIVVFLVMSIVSACGLLPKDSDRDYLKSDTIDPIVVPDGLHVPENRNPMHIPPVADDYQPPEDIIIPPPLSNEEVQLAIAESLVSKSENENGSGIKTDLKPLKAELVSDTDFQVSLLVEDKFDVVWSRLEPVLLSLGFIVEDKNKLTQYYTIYRQIIKIDFNEGDISKPKELELEKSPDKEYYKIKVSEDTQAKPPQQKTRIEVLDRTGDALGSDLDKHLLMQIKQQFENPRVDEPDVDENKANSTKVDETKIDETKHKHE